MNGRLDGLHAGCATSSQQVIEARARAVIKNVLLGGRRANLCIIKGAKGETLRIVVGDPRESRDRAPRQPNVGAPSA